MKQKFINQSNQLIYLCTGADISVLNSCFQYCSKKKKKTKKNICSHHYEYVAEIKKKKN